MDTKEFEQIVVLGLGRAVLHILEQSAHPYREIILDACLHNKAYDPQVEGSRAEYMLELMRNSNDLAFYADAVIQSLAEEADDWDASQRFRIARLLAQEGNQHARHAMRRAFGAAKVSMLDTFGAELIELDGIDGLLFAVRRIGEQLRLASDQWEDDCLLWEAGEFCGREATERALKNAAETDENVRAYLSALEENRAMRKKNQRPDPKDLTYDEVRSWIEADNPGGLLMQWGQAASDSDVKCAARDLINESDIDKLKSYLLIFRKRPFPLEHDRLFQLLELPDGPVPRHVLRVLANLEHQKIRKLAFSLVETQSSLRGFAIDLLINNFHHGDHLVVEAWCDAEQDPRILNDFDRSLRDLFAAHPYAEIELRLLKKFYEREPCAHCRSYIVKRLMEVDSLTDPLRRECEHDSYRDTRELVKTPSAPASAR